MSCDIAHVAIYLDLHCKETHLLSGCQYMEALKTNMPVYWQSLSVM